MYFSWVKGKCSMFDRVAEKDVDEQIYARDLDSQSGI